MKKLLFISAILCGMANYSYAQDDAPPTFSYELKSNDVKFNYLGGGLNYDLSLNNYNMTLVALGPNVKFLGEKISFDANARIHLFEHLADYSGRHPEVFSVYEAEKSKDLSFDLGYFFYNTIRKNEVRVSLGQKRNTKFVSDIPAKTSFRYGANIGFSTGFTYYNFQNQDSDIITLGGAKYITSSYHEFSTLKIGLNKTTVENLSILTDKFGRVTQTSVSKLYFNVLFLVRSQLDDVFVDIEIPGSGQTYSTRYTIDNIERSKLGFCIGYELYNMNDFIIDDKIRDVGYVVEFGSQPGPKNGFVNSLYFDLKLKFNVGKLF